MRLIVEKLDGEVFVYMETEREYDNNEPERIDEGSRRLPFSILNQECDLSAYADNVHWSFYLPSEYGEDEDCEATEDFDCDEPCRMRDRRRREDC